MSSLLKRIFSIFIKENPTQQGKRRKSRGQSLVEIAIAFPVLIMLFTGVVEFGFILNYYLSLLDATRESARFWSGADPFLADGVTANDLLYKETAKLVRTALDPSYNPTTETFNPAYRGRRIALDPAVDDIIVSIYGGDESGVIEWRTAGPYHLFPTPGAVGGNYASLFSADSVEDLRVTDAPNAGILIVEVHYNYHHVLNLPWFTAVLPNPLHLQAYTIMPMRAAEPDE